MHRLKSMKETLISCVQGQLADIKNADTKELGEAVDMIKDLEEAIYYCTITKAMEESEEKEKMSHNCKCETHYYTPYPMYYPYERDMDRDMGRMYYSGQPRNSRGEFMSSRHYEEMFKDNSFASGHHEREMPLEFRDSREGRSPMTRRHYMESKEMHHDKEKKLKELDKYMKELSEDIVEMIEDSSPEERQMLEKKMTHLASKIAQLNANA